ncbi:hypothetical protein O181_040938 [Austropuccinia psidii MF-1]|uniref:Integrase catalytic domain-containing protein n=1 Tax=Austropuccinia psidii MF-1 TaxID=1389203 RepID=A0A9Q3DI79_9BASI|nr:hypothetical protein [Austropuccinia psidii MF-1]
MSRVLTLSVGRPFIATYAQNPRALTDIPKSKPLELLGPFTKDAQGFWYLLTVRDHVSTFTIVYPLKLRSDAPAAILDEITQLRVRTKVAPKALRTDNARGFTLASFVESLAKLGVSFCPSLPYSPQENGEAERLNRKLGDMARAMLTCFWKFAYESACFMHNRIPNSRCMNSSPFQQLYGQPPSILLAQTLWCTYRLCTSATSLMPGQLNGPVGKLYISPVPAGQHASGVPYQRFTAPHCQQNVARAGKALSGAYQENWRAACQAELDQMATWDVWEVLPKLPGMKTIGHCWVFDLKRNLDGTVEKFKARLVARGDRQRPGIDCAEMSAPTAY